MAVGENHPAADPTIADAASREEHFQRPASMARFALTGALLGGLVGGSTLGLESLLQARSLRDVSLTTFLIVYPVVGAILGAFWSRNPEARRWRRGPGFFATEPLPDEERAGRARRVRRSAWIGFGAGIVVALAASALDFTWRGWPYLSEMLNSSLFFGPCFGAFLGFNLGLRAGDPKPSTRDVRFRMRTLMILTAYAALWLFLVVRTSGVSGAARKYHNMAQSARETAKVYQTVLDKEVEDSRRTANAEALRAGRIPDGLLDSQKEFLRSLDRSATKEYRKYRYGLIADVEQLRADTAAGNVITYSRIVDYQRALAEKYNVAAQKPWLPVAPDPPMPR